MVIARKGRLVFVRVRDERKCAGLFGPISAFLLGLIERLIRRLDQINGRRVPAWNRTGKAHADGGAATVRMRNAERLNSLPKRFRHLRGSIRTGTGKDNHKFIAAVPSNQISWPVDGSRDSGGHLPEAFVSRRMAQGIVVGLKTIDVSMIKESGVNSRTARRHSWSKKSSNWRRLVMPVRPSRQDRRSSI